MYIIHVKWKYCYRIFSDLAFEHKFLGVFVALQLHRALDSVNLSSFLKEDLIWRDYFGEGVRRPRYFLDTQ